MEIWTGWLGEGIDLVSGKIGYRVSGENKKRQKRAKDGHRNRRIGVDYGV